MAGMLLSLDTACNVSYLDEIEKDIVLAHNAARSNPQKFAVLYVKEIQGYYSGNILQYPGGLRYRTNEAIAAVNEFYRELENNNPPHSLYSTPCGQVIAINFSCCSCSHTTATHSSMRALRA